MLDFLHVKKSSLHWSADNFCYVHSLSGCLHTGQAKILTGYYCQAVFLSLVLARCCILSRWKASPCRRTIFRCVGATILSSLLTSELLVYKAHQTECSKHSMNQLIQIHSNMQLHLYSRLNLNHLLPDIHVFTLLESHGCCTAKQAANHLPRMLLD